MKKLSLFIHIDSGTPGNPTTQAIELVTRTAHEVQLMTDLVDDAGIEADFAVYNNATRALTALKETDTTFILIAYLSDSDGRIANSLAARYPKRISACPFIDTTTEPAFITALLKLLNEKVQEAA